MEVHRQNCPNKEEIAPVPEEEEEGFHFMQPKRVFARMQHS